MKHALLIAAALCLPFAAQAETLQEKLDAKKAAFSAKATHDKKSDYERGVAYVTESGILEKAKNVGDKAPDFTLPNAVEKSVTLSELLKTGPVAMVWHRGEWCPYCNIQLEDIQQHMAEFKVLGAHVVAISPQMADRSFSMRDRLNLEFHVLSDVGNKAAHAYGVAYKTPDYIVKHLTSFTDLHKGNGDESDVLPLGAAYVIAQDGTISYAYLNGDYRKRVETTTLLEEIKKLKK